MVELQLKNWQDPRRARFYHGSLDITATTLSSLLRMSGGPPFPAHCQSAAARRHNGQHDGRDGVLRMSGGPPFPAHCQSAALRRLNGRDGRRDIVETTADERRSSVSRSLSIRSSPTTQRTRRWRFPLTLIPTQDWAPGSSHTQCRRSCSRICTMHR